MRVMEVAYHEDEATCIDFIPENDWPLWVKDFFIEGGLNIPIEINESKTLDNLTEKDYKLFFEELGWDVLGFFNYDPDIHKKYNIKTIEDKDNPRAKA